MFYYLQQNTLFIENRLICITDVGYALLGRLCDARLVKSRNIGNAGPPRSNMRITDNAVKNDYSNILELLLQFDELQVTSSHNNKFFSIVNIESILVTKYNALYDKHIEELRGAFCALRPRFFYQNADHVDDYYKFSSHKPKATKVTFFNEVLFSPSFEVRVSSF